MGQSPGIGVFCRTASWLALCCMQLRLDYSGRDHAGLKAGIPTVIRGGRAVPFTDWAMVK
jgi:hypothetical protein